MKDKQQSLAVAIIIVNLAMGASAVFAQSLPEKFRLELLKQIQPATPWQVAQPVPGPELHPSQRGTIPERMPSPDSGSQHERRLLRENQEGTRSFEGERIGSGCDQRPNAC